MRGPLRVASSSPPLAATVPPLTGFTPLARIALSACAVACFSLPSCSRGEPPATASGSGSAGSPTSAAAGAAAAATGAAIAGSAAPAGSPSTAGPAGAAPAGSAAASRTPRLVSLTPSATEVVAALGATTWLVGVDDYSTYPPEVTRLPKVGSFLAPNLETIVALSPTLVIVDDIHSQVAGALGDAGVTTVACPVHALPDIKAALHIVGARIGKSAEADRVTAAIDSALDRAAASRPARRPRVLAVIDREGQGLGNLVAAGPGSWIDELIAVAGGDNVLAAAPSRYPKISTEEVLRGKPDVILDLSYAAREGLAPWKALDVPAVATGRVRSLQEAYLRAPSPRVAEALADIARAMR